MLCFIEATQILNRFNIRNKVLEIHCIQESENNENYRGLFQITTENKVYVCRISNEKNFPMPLVEKQSQFAMILHANGVNTARKYRCQNNYCIHHLINGIEMQRIYRRGFIGCRHRLFKGIWRSIGKSSFCFFKASICNW